MAYKPIMKQICAQFGGKTDIRMAKAKAVSLKGGLEIAKGWRDGVPGNVSNDLFQNFVHGGFISHWFNL